MAKVILEKSPWKEWKIETILRRDASGIVYKAVRTEGENKYYSAIRHISLPGSQQETDNAVNMGVNPDPVSLNQYFGRMADAYINEINALYQLRGNASIVSYEDHKIQKRGNGVGVDIFIRTELLQPLAEYLKNRTPDEAEIARLGADICTAVSLCSARGIVHRDITPSCLYVSESGSFKLGDFGFSILKPGSGISGGTPAFMAPELLSGKAAFSQHTDIYALGLILYKLLNNDLLPFVVPGQSAMESPAARRVRGEPIPAPVNGNPALNGIILKAIAFLPENRYGSAQEFRMALVSYTQGNMPAANSSPVAASVRADPAFQSGVNQPLYPPYQRPAAPVPPPQVVCSMPVPPAPKQTSGKPKTIHLIIICATVCILAALFAVVLIFRNNDDTSSEEARDSTVSSSAGRNDISSGSYLETEEWSGPESTGFETEPDPSNVIPVKKATCSSHAGNGKYDRKYGANMAVDGKAHTCWMAYGVPAGKGNWIKLDFGKKTTVTGVKLINGNTWNGKYNGKFIDGYNNLYEKNGRLRRFTAEFSDGSTFTGEAYDVKDTSFDSNIFYFDAPVETSYVIIHVDSGYKGNKYKNNVCIGEIQAFC